MDIEISGYIKNLNEGEKKIINQDTFKVLLIKHKGNYFALDAICSHEEQSLEEGFLDNDCIECPKHGAKFDLNTGAVKALPALKPIKVYRIIYEKDKWILRM